ncbi:hypothetical protein [Massilia yuzhufengensis]|uniref:Uncharacterized protein n=1 Tax=Massilia yuzhufengensis TaxID=1164594 RepID=A0A1I1D9K1_9BURK|nr:hypothetical protein [Massilia yuzhufengensis]SFB71689.1 hypothetical protein SAMN05216204_10197 [Massilia yuzhufengensis]
MKSGQTAQTQLNKDTFTDVPVKAKRKVTYRFNIVSHPKLNLPYAVTVNGRIPDIYKGKPRKLDTESGFIVIENVSPGEKVSLYLNSDSYPNYRNHPVYSVTPTDSDVLVIVTEKKGKHTDTDTPIKSIENAVSEKNKKIETLVAPLTGDIWMRLSHKYTVLEIENLIPADTNPSVKLAVKSIYDGLSQPNLKISIAAPNSAPQLVTLYFNDADNARKNITSFDFLTDILTRVHPAAYAAAIQAALEAGIAVLRITSTWRPMEGSIAHRAGLGLDVNVINDIRLNRQELTKSKAIDTANVSQSEKELFVKLTEKKTARDIAAQKLAQAQSELRNAKSNPGLLISAKQNLQGVEQVHKIAVDEQKKAEIAWGLERDMNEPDDIRRFRSALIKSQSVTQIYDPWFMDDNTRDNVDPSANFQKTKNEITHAHHLHITVRDARIL